MMDDKIIWDASYSVGIEKIDEQHKEILGLINRLDNYLKNGVTEKEIEEVANELFDYAEFHFRTEEDLMEKYLYPMKAEHIEEHRKFVKKINEIKNEKDLFTKGLEIITFLYDWLLNHISTEDKKYTPYFLVQ